MQNYGIEGRKQSLTILLIYRLWGKRRARLANIMKKTEAEEILYCAMTVGEQILRSGGEAGRVEDTIRRICLAYGASRVDVFSITSSIITTMYGEEFGVCTQTRRVTGMVNDLDRLDRLNQLSREICEKKVPYPIIREKLSMIDKAPKYSFAMQLVVYALISGAFSVFFGGNLGDAIASALIGILLKLMQDFISKGSVNALLSALLVSIFGGFLAKLFVLLGIGSHLDLISIGNIMLLIPGIPLTNSLRDMFSGDIITGLIRFMESILLALVIALGFTVVGFVL